MQWSNDFNVDGGYTVQYRIVSSLAFFFFFFALLFYFGCWLWFCFFCLAGHYLLGCDKGFVYVCARWFRGHKICVVSIKLYGLLNKWNYACAVIVLLFDYALSVIISRSRIPFHSHFCMLQPIEQIFSFEKNLGAHSAHFFFSRVLRRFFIANVFFCFVFMNKSVFYMYLLFWLWICGIGSSILVLNLILPFLFAQFFVSVDVCACEYISPTQYYVMNASILCDTIDVMIA